MINIMALTIININKISEDIVNIKYPAIFITSLLYNIDYFDDISLAIVLKLFIIKQIDFVIKNDIKKLFGLFLPKDSQSWNIIDTFYKLLYKKLQIINVLQIWYNMYGFNSFWVKPIKNQIETVNLLKERFYSIYDCAKGGIPLHLKLVTLFKSTYDKDSVMEMLIERLVNIVDLFGYKVFHFLEIKLIKIREFELLSEPDILIYFYDIFNKFSELLTQLCKLFNKYKDTCDELDILLNPEMFDTLYDSSDEDIMDIPFD